MNNATFTGRLGKNAELKTLPDGKKVINFSIAVDRGKDKQPLWVDCARWSDKTAVLPYLTKGTMVGVSGPIDLRTWDNGAAITIRVNDLELLGGKQEAAVVENTIPQSDNLPF